MCQEWAGCVEADPPQMAQLMLKELLKAEVGELEDNLENLVMYM